MDIVAETMTRAFRQKLAEGGTLLHTSLGTTIKGLVTAGDMLATFGIGDQEQEERLSVTCLRADAVPTGTTVSVDGRQYVVSGQQARPGAPVVRLHLVLQAGEGDEDA